MILARHRFHHLVLEARSTLPVDPAAQLLATLPPAPPEAPIDLRLESRAATGADLAPRLPGPPAFTLGQLTLRVGGGAVELCWPGARFTVDALPLPRAIGLIDPAALEVPLELQALVQGPARFALSAALRARGLFHLLAGAVVLPGERTVLVAGPPGAGKSTLAAALVANGAEPLGDDGVYLARRDGTLRLLALPGELQRVDAAAPTVILLPRITGQATSRLEPAGPAEALGALLGSSFPPATRGLPGGEGHLPLLGALADGARVLRAELGLDLLADGPAVARRLISELADA